MDHNHKMEDQLPHTNTTQAFENFDSPQNLSCKEGRPNQNYSLPSPENASDRESTKCDYPTAFSVYCMTDPAGLLHFSLSSFLESSSSPEEQKNLGRQLIVCIRDHSNNYDSTHNALQTLEYSQEGSQSSSSSATSQTLFADFTSHYPSYNLNYQTYTTVLNHLESTGQRTIPEQSTSITIADNNVSDINVSNQKDSLTMSSPNLIDSHSNSSACNTTALDKDSPTPKTNENQVGENEDTTANDNKALFFNHLQICPRKGNQTSNVEDVTDNSIQDHLPSSASEPSLQLECFSSAVSGKKRFKQKTKPTPLPPKCSCPANKCTLDFEERDRQQICKLFWSRKNAKGRFQWIGASVQEHFPFCLKSQSHSIKRRNFFVGKCFLHKSVAGKVQVCKNFFLTTLGLHYFFPLYDILRHKAFKNNKPSKQSSPSKSVSRARRSKKKSILKHHMKKHVRKYFLRLCRNSKITRSSVLSQVKKSFRHFANQFPHLLDDKSFKKYVSIISKVFNHMKERSRGNSKTASSASEAPTSVSTGSDGRIMKMEPQDFDDVLADDMASKFEAMTGNNSLERKKSWAYQDALNSNPVALPETSNEDSNRLPPAVNENTDLATAPKVHRKPIGRPKGSKRPYTKRMNGTGVPKLPKGTNPRGRPRKTEQPPPKVYKINVNELEDDQSKHPMLPSCNCSKPSCASKELDGNRQTLYSNFWDMDYISRRTWMVKHVHILKPKSRSNLATARLHQMHRKFFMPDANGELRVVCKRFFLSTLGFKGVGVLRPQQIPGTINAAREKEPRKRLLSFKICQQDILSVMRYCQTFSKERDIKFYGDKRFMNSMNKDISDEMKQRITVPYGFTWKELYKDYCLKHSHVQFGYQTFRSILSVVDHNSFFEDIPDKFQNFIDSEADEMENNTSEGQQKGYFESLSTSYQEQINLLKSFPQGFGTFPKKYIPKGPARKPVAQPKEPKREPEVKIRKPRKKLKLSQSFLTDFTQSVKCFKPRTTTNSRYNFREGVPVVTYSFDTDRAIQNDDFYDNDWDENGYDETADTAIKEENLSDQEKVVVKAPSKPSKTKMQNKKVGGLPGRKKNKKHKNKVKVKAGRGRPRKHVISDTEDESAPKTDTPRKRKRAPKMPWNLKIDIKQKESTKKFKSRHPILPPCKCSYRKCNEKIPPAQREVIHDIYWSINNKQDRCKWVLDHIQRNSPKTRSNTTLISRKRETRRYFFPNADNEIVEVCRVFFLRTLGYQWDSVVDTVSRTLPRPGGYLAKRLGFTEEQVPYETMMDIKTFLKRKKIKRSTISPEDFPEISKIEAEGEEDIFTLEGYTLRDLYEEYVEFRPDFIQNLHAFKQIVRFILVPGCEVQTETSIKQEEESKAGVEQIDTTQLGSAGIGPEEDPNVTYFTPEFEKQDIEKALSRKARRRRPISSRNSKEQHPMREPCNCIRKCRDKIDQSKREQIHEEYWNLITYNQRKQWILEHIKREAPKRRTNLTRPIKKMETRRFFLKDWSGQKIEICKGFFLSTLGFKWDKMVDTICKTTPRDGQFVRPDQRGKKPPSHKLSQTLITSVTNYVESILETAACVYPKGPSKTASGKPKKAADRMPYGLTMKNLFEDYKIKFPNYKVGYESFRKIYRSVLQSDKFRPALSSSPPHVHDDDDDNGVMEPLPQPPAQLNNLAMMAANMDSSSVDRASEPEVPPSFEVAQQSCMYKGQTGGMRLHQPEQAHTHATPYQRQCEPSAMKPFSEGINTFPKSHDVQFYSPNLEQNEEMSMQMYKSICLPSSNPNQFSTFYPNSLPLDTFPMGSGSQGLHGGLPYSDSLRHSDLMHHHHHYQPPHHHFGQGRFHGFVFPPGTSKDEPSHHQHSDMNVSHNYRGDFDCNPYPGKNPLVYPPTYPVVNSDNMPSSSAPRHSYNNLPMQAHSIHDMRIRDTSVSAPTAAANLLLNDSSSSSCHLPGAPPTNTPTAHHQAGNEWQPHIPSSMSSKEPLQAVIDPTAGKKVKKPRGKKRQPKEKVPKVKREKKVRPPSTRNSKEHNPMLPPCKCTSKKCLEKIPEPRRVFIYNMFWDLGNYNSRKQWIAEHIRREDPKRRTSLDNPLRRMETRRFFLPNVEGEKLEVCKGFFLRTLGFKWDKMVDTICKTTEKGQTVVRPDMRGKKGPSHKLNTEVASSVESYVRSILQAAKPAYDASVEQQQQSDAPPDKDIFVPYGLTMKNFHEDYKGKHAHHKVGYESFRKIYRRVSQEVLGNVTLTEDEAGNLVPSSPPPDASETPAKEASDVINPVTGLPQSA